MVFSDLHTTPITPFGLSYLKVKKMYLNYDDKKLLYDLLINLKKCGLLNSIYNEKALLFQYEKNLELNGFDKNTLEVYK